MASVQLTLVILISCRLLATQQICGLIDTRILPHKCDRDCSIEDFSAWKEENVKTVSELGLNHIKLTAPCTTALYVSDHPDENYEIDPSLPCEAR